MKALFIISLILAGSYAFVSFTWLHVKFEFTTGFDFVVLDNPSKVKFIHGDHGDIDYRAIDTDVQTTTDSGYLSYEEYYLHGEFTGLTCENAPNCPGGYYMYLTNCMI